MKKSFFELMKLESKAYYSLDDIDRQLDSSASLENIPYQPLYSAIKKLDSGELAEVLPRLSSKQQYVFQSLDLWQKDDVNPSEFEDWVRAYAECRDEETRQGFVKSEAFLLYLKSAFNLWTFDVEDPQYPDHDYYFLTEDSLLLFEYHENYPYVDEIKLLIKELYSEFGVEKAYSHLFKVISEDYLTFLEEEYDLKKKNLRDFGFVDYFDALQKTTPFPSVDLMKIRLNQTKAMTPRIDNISEHQVLPIDIMRAFDENNQNVLASNSLNFDLKDERNKYLRFDFIQLINSVLTRDSSLKKGSLAVKKSAEEVEKKVSLGVSFLQHEHQLSAKESIFSSFSMSDCYRAGVTLLSELEKETRKNLRECGIQHVTKIFGDMIFNFFSEFFEEGQKYFNYRDQKEIHIVDYETLKAFQSDVKLMLSLVEVSAPLMGSFNKILKEGEINNHLYLNYEVSEIDFEAIILSMLSNHLLGTPKESKKLGLTPNELKKLMLEIFKESQTENKVKDFLKDMQFPMIDETYDYIQTLFEFHLEGYDLTTIDESEFKYIGGIIILNTLN